MKIKARDVIRLPKYSLIKKVQDNTCWKLGNDLVDLSLPNTHSKFLEQRFLQRVFTQYEQKSIHQSFDKNKVLWSIWAAKEAAFKACQKHLPHLIFSHQKFSIKKKTLLTLQNLTSFKETTGALFYKGLTVYLKWQWYESVIHCMAILALGKFTKKDWRRISYKLEEHKPLSARVKKLLIRQHFTKKELRSIFSEETLWSRYCAKRFFLSFNHYKRVEVIRSVVKFTQKKRLGPPALYVDSTLFPNLEISLSHDGHWVASTFLPNKTSRLTAFVLRENKSFNKFIKS